MSATDRLGVLRQVILSVDDLPSAVNFYQRELGLEAKVLDPERWATFDLGGLTLALAGGTERPSHEGAVLAVKVPDLDSALARVLGSGGRVVSEPTQGGHERRAEVVDRFGAKLVLYQPAGN